MDRREIEQLVAAIRQAERAGEPAAIATIVRIKGSAYRREGTRMFVRRDGTYECALSGGCLEPAVADAAARVIATGVPAMVRYDLADDSVWGLGIGCSGAVDIRIERMGSDRLTTAWLEILERGEAAALVTSLAGVSGQLIVGPDGRVLGALSDAAVQREAVIRAIARLKREEHSLSAGPERIGSAELFFDVSLPPPQLVVFGAGHDTAPVAQLAWQLGFAVTVVDARQALLTGDRFPGAKLVCTDASGFGERVPIEPGSYVLVMNHHLQRDEESLRHAVQSDAVYIGVLGPRTRYEKLLSGLENRGWTPAPSALQHVRSPVGLSLGAETPQEVAVSILGEMLAVRRGFDGGFLSGRVESLHRPDASRAAARS